MDKNEKYNQSYYRKADQLIRNYQVLTRKNKKEVLDTLLHRIEKDQPAEKKIKKKISLYITASLSAAATIAILISMWFFTASETISVPKGETMAYRLPDDSRVVLYNESSISFRKYFWNRNVSLVGEAYFEVEKGEDFHVKTVRGSVDVLGTRFLVDAGGNSFNVRCFQGSVKTNFNSESWIMESGTRFTGMDETAQLEKVENENNYPEFALFQFNFSNTPLREVADEIETFFNVEIEISAASDKKFSGHVETGKLENILRIVCQSLQLNYRFESEYRIIIY